jgi:hypothetical protein
MGSYPSGKTLISQIDPTVPTDDEVNSKWPSVDRQLRDFLVTFLTVAHTDAGVIKPLAVKSGCYDVGSIVTADIADDTIIDDNISPTADIDGSKLLDASVTSAKLAGTLDISTNLASGTIPGSAIKANDIDYTQLKADSVRAAAIQDDAVTTDKIKDANVTHDKLAAAAVDGDNIVQSDGTNTASAAIPLLAVAGGADSGTYKVGGDLTATIDTTLTPHVLKLVVAAAGGTSSGRYARLVRKTAYNTAGGSAAAGDQCIGGWSVDVGTSLVTMYGSGGDAYFVVGVAGTYLVMGWDSAYSVGKHRFWLGVQGTTDTLLLLGSSEHAPYGVQNRSSFEGIVVVPANSTIYGLHHYTELAQATNGFGLPVGLTYATVQQTELFGVIQFIKL